jgi:TPR repeat protein
MIWHGRGIVPSASRAVDILQQIAARGFHPPTSFALGDMFLTGEAGITDYYAARDLFKAVAECAHPLAAEARHKYNVIDHNIRIADQKSFEKYHNSKNVQLPEEDEYALLF